MAFGPRRLLGRESTENIVLAKRYSRRVAWQVSSDFIKAEVVIKTLPIYHRLSAQTSSIFGLGLVGLLSLITQGIATPEGSRRESVVHPQLSDGEDEVGAHDGWRPSHENAMHMKCTV